MCGISGIINRKNQAVESSLIEEMNRQIIHRGPDGEGFYFGDNFAFGHRRLSIIDLSEDGKQPMEYLSKNIICFNGEIYNYLELRVELEAFGHHFNTKTDTEVILAAYTEWGSECVSRFNGMWSFALYDKDKKQIFCSRDRFGIKPFYFFQSEKFFAFGSEIKQLLSFLPAIKSNQQVLLDYLITGMEEHNDDTFFSGIQKLPGGNNLIYDLKSHEFEIKSFYELKSDSSLKNITEEKAVELYEAQFYQSVKLRMRSDVEVGVCLSGGLDSSSITAISARILRSESDQKIKTIHAKVNVDRIDESGYAEQVAAHCKTDLILVEPTYEDFRDSLSEVIKIQEEPFGSPSIILQYFVLKKARKMNCLVMLDGQGGDETLLGYERYYPAFILKQKGLKRMRAFLDSSKNSKLSQLDLIKYYFYFTRYKLRMSQLKSRHRYIKEEILSSFESPILKELTKKYMIIGELQKLEIRKTQLPHLLKYEDKNSMANSVEARLPFLDYRCVELAHSIPDEYKINSGWTKSVLRKAIQPHLPKSVVWRKDKLGFNAPEEEWLSRMTDEMNESILSSKIIQSLINVDKFQFETLDLRTKWRLFNVSKWEETFQVTL